MHFSQTREFAMHRAQNKRKVPLTCREHENHVTEGHWTIVSILEISRLTWIIIEMWTLYNYCWIICRWRRSMSGRNITRELPCHKRDKTTWSQKHANKRATSVQQKCGRWPNIIEAELENTWIGRTELESWNQVESRGGKILVRINTRVSRQAGKRTRRRLSLAETRDTSRLRCRQQKRLTDKSGTCDFGWSWSFNKIELRLTHLAESWIRLLLYPLTENCR